MKKVNENWFVIAWLLGWKGYWEKTGKTWRFLAWLSGKEGIKKDK